MADMIVRDIIDYVQLTVGARRYWNDQRIVSFINQVQDKMAVMLKLTCQDFYKFESTLDQRYEIPSTYVNNQLMYYGNGGSEQVITILPTPNNIYGVFNNPDTDSTDNPSRAFIWNTSGRKELWIYPKFATAGIEVWWFFWGLPSKLTNDNDTSPLPPEWHILIVEAVINKIKVADEYMSGIEELELFKQLVHTAKTMETTKGIIERGSIIQPYDQFPSVGGIGLIDGSANGIKWD
jgi:hypothetical protein